MTTIPPQLPQIVMAARQATIQGLVLQAGQMLDATIIAPSANGGMQVKIEGQLLNLVLPVPVKPGQVIRLQVQGSGAQMKLALQPAITNSPTTAMPAPQAGVAPPIPAASPAVPEGLQIPVLGPNAPSQQRPAPLPQQAQLPSVPTAAPVRMEAPLPVNAATQSAPSAPGIPVSAAPVNVAPASSPILAVQTQPAASPAIQPTTMSASQPIAPTNPYAQAVPPRAAVPPPITTATPSALVSAPSAQLVAQVAPSSTQSAQPPLTATAPPPPAQASTPQAALSQMVQAAVPRQGSIVALTTALTAVAGQVALPEPVIKAAQQVLAARVAIDAPHFDGSALRAAVQGSGVFQEATLASGQLPLPQADMKSALLSLRQTLVTWLGHQAPMASVAQVAPPLRGAVPRARGGDAPPIDPALGSEEVGKHLLERTESSLSRVRLHQHASLPDPVVKTADWSMDLPVMIGTYQTVMQFQIHRDQQSESEAPMERGWQMRFALNLPSLGEVGAQVSLRAGMTGVMLWASEPETSAALETEVGLLREALSAANLRLGAVVVRHGKPPSPPVAPSGHFVDATT